MYQIKNKNIYTPNSDILFCNLFPLCNCKKYFFECCNLITRILQSFCKAAQRIFEDWIFISDFVIILWAVRDLVAECKTVKPLGSLFSLPELSIILFSKTFSIREQSYAKLLISPCTCTSSRTMWVPFLFHSTYFSGAVLPFDNLQET